MKVKKNNTVQDTHENGNIIKTQMQIIQQTCMPKRRLILRPGTNVDISFFLVHSKMS